MFYDEAKAIESCIEDPSLIFELIKEGHFELVDKLLTKKLVDINTCDESGNNVLMRLLKRGQYELVLKHSLPITISPLATFLSFPPAVPILIIAIGL